MAACSLQRLLQWGGPLFVPVILAWAATSQIGAMAGDVFSSGSEGGGQSSSGEGCYLRLAEMEAYVAAHLGKSPPGYTYCCDDARSRLRGCAPGVGEGCCGAGRSLSGGSSTPAGGGDKGLVRTDCAEAAAKGIVRKGCPPLETKEPKVQAATTAQLLAAIDRCLETSGLTYYLPPAQGSAPGSVRYDPGVGRVVYDPVFLGKQTPYVRAFWLAEAHAAHVLNLEQQQFGVARQPLVTVRAREYLTGYVTHCLVDAGVLPATLNRSPDDPRSQYERYRRRGGFALPGDPRLAPGDIADWKIGWGDYGMRVIFSLRHDPEPPPTSYDPYVP